jgi:ABC-type oligopeptide transport system substrate-binding subunit
MNSKTFLVTLMTMAITSVVATAHSTSQAQEAMSDRPVVFASASTSASTLTPSKTRAQVQIELAAANASGLQRFSEATQIAPIPNTESSVTRELVAAEAQEAQRLGLTTGGEFTLIANEKQVAAILNARRAAEGNATRRAGALLVVTN